MTNPTPELLALQNALAGRYAVERLLGQGGMGQVFLAFEALPEAQRRQFPNVPEVVTRLQADALESTNGHRMQAMAALENLRLDLLRLQAGQVQADQLTRDLDQARRLSAVNDRAVDERRS